MSKSLNMVCTVLPRVTPDHCAMRVCEVVWGNSVSLGRHISFFSSLGLSWTFPWAALFRFPLLVAFSLVTYLPGRRWENLVSIVISQVCFSVICFFFFNFFQDLLSLNKKKNRQVLQIVAERLWKGHRRNLEISKNRSCCQSFLKFLWYIDYISHGLCCLHRHSLNTIIKRN